MQSKTLSITDSVFVSSLTLQQVDTINLTNCTFTGIKGYALFIDKAKSVRIMNCTFKNISNTLQGSNHGVLCGNGILSMQILNCVFDDIEGTAIRFPVGGTIKPEDRNGSIIMSGCRIQRIRSKDNFLGNGIVMFHVNSVFVLGNRFTNIDHHAMVFGRNGTPQELDIQRIDMSMIQGNRIDSVLGNGILVCENVINPQVKDNQIYHIAYDGKGALPDEGDHGIYWQAKGGLIQNNGVLYNRDGMVQGNPGSGISIRSNAQVLQNITGYCTGNGIGYYADHDAKGTLTIMNNVIFNNQRNGLYLNANGVQGKQPDSVIILHNTILNEKVQDLSHQSCPIALNEIKSPFTIAGNYTVFVNQLNPLDHIRMFNTTNQSNVIYNLFASNASEFVNPSIGDFKLLENSVAINYAKHGISIMLDRDNRFRNGIPDAGAYEYSIPASIREDVSGFITTMNQIIMREERNVKACAIYSFTGEQEACSFTQDQSTLSLSIPESLPAGVYLCRITYADEKIREFPIIHMP